jgi:hypothetical protein
MINGSALALSVPRVILSPAGRLISTPPSNIRRKHWQNKSKVYMDSISFKRSNVPSRA